MITRTLLAAHEPFFYLTYTYFCVLEKDCTWNELDIFGLAMSFFSFHTSISCRDLNGKILLMTVYPHLRIKR